MCPPLTADARGRTSRRLALAVLAIRSDSLTAFQQRAEVAEVPFRTFNLRALPVAEFRAVIERPAERATAAGNKLAIDPKLTERLLEVSQGPDALPLLAFVLWHLFREYGAGGALRLEHYQMLGGLQRFVVGAIDAALADPFRHPVVPAEEGARERLLRDAFIPWLATVDPDTGQRKRRIARWSEIPLGSRPLVQRLVDAHLLTCDQPFGAKDVTVEVAHEALLRVWPLLSASAR